MTPVSRLTLSTLALLVTAVTCNSVHADSIETTYQRHLGTARKVAVAQDKPMMIFIGGENCIFCEKMKKAVLSERTTKQQIESSFVPIYLKFEDNPRAMEILKVNGLPTTIVLSPKADVLGRARGYRSPEEMQKFLDETLKKHTAVRSVSFRP